MGQPLCIINLKNPFSTFSESTLHSLHILSLLLMLRALKQVRGNGTHFLSFTHCGKCGRYSCNPLIALVRNIHHTRLARINPFINATGICGIAIQKLGQHFSKGRLFDASTAPLGVYSVCKITFCIAWSE